MANFESDMGRAARIAEKNFRQIERDGKKMHDQMVRDAKRIGVAIGTGLTVAAGAITAMTKSAIDNADAMRDMSIRVGVSTETLSAYNYAATQTGTNMESLGKGLKILAKNAADAINPTNEYAKVFDALGIKVTDSGGKLRSLSELIPEIADRFKVMEDGTTKAALAQSLFGRAGLEMTEFLNQGSAGLEKFSERAAELGLIVDSQTAVAADNFNDTLGDLKAVSQGYALHLARELLPDLQSLADRFTDTATEGNKVKEMAEGTAQFLRGLATVAHIVSSAFEIAGASMATLTAQGVAYTKMLRGDLAGGIDLYGAALGGLKAEWDEALGRDRGAQPKVGLVFAGEGPDPAGLFKNSEQELALKAQMKDMEARLAKALSNPTAPGGSRTPKLSDAEKEARKLEDAYGDLIAKQLEQIALFGETTEAARVRYEVEQGSLKNLTQAQKDAAIANAEWLDWMADMEALDGVRADVAAENNQRIIDSWADATDQMSVFAEQAGRNMQDAFADFLFDPFENGVQGMLESFGNILRRMAAEMLASQVFDMLGKWGEANAGTGGWVGAIAGLFKGFGGKRAWRRGGRLQAVRSRRGRSAGTAGAKRAHVSDSG